MDEKLEELSARISVADISSAISYGLQRALVRREIANTIGDKIIRYGGRLEFNIEIAPSINRGVIAETQLTQEG